MARKILFFCFFFCLCVIHTITADPSRSITMMEQKVSQLIFPSDIKSIKGGYLASDFAITVENNVLYIQPIGEFQETNLNVLTNDGYYYTFMIAYDVNTLQFNYIIHPSEAIYRDPAMSGSMVGKEVSVKNNSGNKDQETTIAPIPVVSSVDTKINSEKSKPSIEKACVEILKKSGYIYTRNVDRMKNVLMSVKGIYSDKQNVYIRLQIDNKSNIQYDIEALTFYVQADVKGVATTQEQTQLLPIYIHNMMSHIKPKNRLEIVCVFSRFTIGLEKVLVASLIEKNGERNLYLEIDNTLILGAQRYE